MTLAKTSASLARTGTAKPAPCTRRRAWPTTKRGTRCTRYRTCCFDITFYLDKGELGATRKLSFPAEKGKTRMTGDEFCRRHRSGNYILHLAHRVVAVEGGIAYDAFDSSARCVYEAWEINARLDLEPEGDK